MQLAPPGSHRAFMGASWTVAILITMALTLGWRHHFKMVQHRRTIIELAERAEKSRQIQPNSGTRVVSAPGTILPETPSLLLGAQKPLKFDPTASIIPEQTTVEVLPLANASTVMAEAEEMVRRYYETPNWQDRLKYVFEPERVRSLMEDFYERQRGVDPVMGAMIDQGRFRLDGTEIVLISYRSARPEGKLEIALRRTQNERLVIDWESYVGYSEKSMPDMIASKPVKPVLLRIFVKLDDYYNYEFTDKAKLISVKLTAPDGDSYVNAYCERESAMGRWLINDLGANPKDSLTKGYTVWVAYPENAQSDRCVKLIQIPAGRWLIVPPKK